MGKNGKWRKNENGKRNNGTTNPALQAMYDFFGAYALDGVAHTKRVLEACQGARLDVGYERDTNTLHLRTYDLNALSRLFDTFPRMCSSGVKFSYAQGG